jgi:hypothetical protein
LIATISLTFMNSKEPERIAEVERRPTAERPHWVQPVWKRVHLLS